MTTPKGEAEGSKQCITEPIKNDRGAFEMTHILTTMRSTIFKGVFVMTMLASSCAYAQLFALSKQEVIDYTAKSPFDRFADGRPKVPDALIEQARDLSSEEVWAALD